MAETQVPQQSNSGSMITLKGLFGLMIDAETQTVVRPEVLPFPLLPANPNFVNGVGSRDIVISDSPPIWGRMFLPESPRRGKTKLPVILYFHGGGFIMLSPAISFYHQLCEKIARKANALVISVDYRLVPENRLPAAYEDAAVALEWLDQQACSGAAADPWLADKDFGACFLMGDSAGANIVHHLVRAEVKVKAVKVRGVVMVQPMMSGVDRVRSEVVAVRSGFYAVETNDWLWRLALPRGADMSHPYCDLVAAAAGEDEVAGGVAAMVVMGGLDWMHDRQFEYAAALRRRSGGGEVEVVDYEHAKHGFFIHDTPETSKFFKSLAVFIDRHSLIV